MKSKINVVFNLAFLLERDNISQAQLIRDVKAVSKAQVYRWIHKGEMPHVGYVLRMHEAYGWTLREMFKEESEMNDTVYVVIDLFGLKESIAGATIDINTANMLCASVLEGHSRFIEMFENGVKVGEGGYRD